MMRVIDTLAPVFLVIALGACLRKGGFLTADFQRGLNRLAYWVALPALLFHKIATAPALNEGVGATTAILLGGTGVLLIASLLVAKAIGLKGPAVGTFSQASFRGNLAFIGLPVVFLAFDCVADVSGVPADQAKTLAALTLAPSVAAYNVVSVIVLLASRHRFNRSAIRPMLVQVATNPLIISCVLGGIWYQWSLPLPAFLAGSIDIVGGAALPAALLCVGGALVTTPVRGHIRPAALAALFKVAAGPAIGFGLATLLGADYTQTYVAVLLLACPTAVASYILADQLGGDSDLAASAIVVSTIASAISLGVIVAMM